MATRKFNRNLLSLDDNLVTIEAPMLFGASGSPVLRQWRPSEVGTQAGAYENAPAGGCEGMIGIFKRAPGIFRAVFQDDYVRPKGLTATYENSAFLGIAAPVVQMNAGTMASTYPDTTNLNVERLEAGHTGTAAAAAQPTFVVAGATFPATVIGMLFTDSAGVAATILNASGDTITLSGVVTPATGAGWTITSAGTLVFNVTILAGGRSSTAFIPATFTVGGAVWLVNRWKGHVLEDSAGALLTVQSNTATVLTLQSIPSGTNPTTGAYVIRQGFVPGGPGNPTFYSVTGPQITGTGNTGTGSANTWTPAATTNWVAGIFANMFLVDGDGVQWLITANSTSTLTVASNGSDTTPTTGTTWAILSVAGAASIEFTTKALAVGSLSAAGQVNYGLPANVVVNGSGITGTSAAHIFTVVSGGFVAASNALVGATFTDGVGSFLIIANSALTATSGTITVDGAPAATVTAVGAVYHTVNNASAVTGTLTQSVTDPAAGERLLLSFLLSDSTVME